MPDWIYIGAIVILALWVLLKYLEIDDKTDKKDYSNAYQRKLLLTKNEWKNYMSMRQQLEGEGLRICPKVRLLDLIEPKKCSNAKERRALLNKIQSKHVDFTICDEKLNVLLVLELDDSSHEAESRRQRDLFVDSVLTGAGYQILHVRNCEKEMEAIQAAIAEIRTPAASQTTTSNP